MKSSESISRQRAWNYALRLLAARDYTSARLRSKLGDKGFEAEDVAAVVERVLAEGWVDDRRFAERFVDSARTTGRYFGFRLRQELQKRGVSPELAAEVIGNRSADHNEYDDILAVCERRFSAFSFEAATDREKRRLTGYLQRRGFSFSAIMRALQHHRQV